ncbi:vanadium-dependent haloperoxidase [Kitasatospora sp. NPDC096147]|uniref:vanadium-dependent haloperoxidase n=1 Tax=Kitasatospora sp. NPDC096147 TaxID=3364093 RepID=UPI00381194D8
MNPTRTVRTTARRRLPALVTAVALSAAVLTVATGGPAEARSDLAAPRPGDNAVLQWNTQLLDSLRAATAASGKNTPPPVGPRAIGILNACVFDAWAAYDHRAKATQLGDRLRRPWWQRTAAAQREAVNYAAHQALSDLLPAQRATFDQKLRDLGHDPAAARPDATVEQARQAGTPAAVAGASCGAVLRDRHADGSNQLGTPPYAAAPGTYVPANPPQDQEHFDRAALIHPERWAPLVQNGVTQAFITPQFPEVRPFVLKDPKSFLPAPPPAPGTPASDAAIDRQLERSAGLTDRQKAIAEYWMYPAETSGGITLEWARYLSHRDRHSLAEDVKMHFALGLAEADAGVVIWDAKRSFDYARPITLIRYERSGQQVRGWAGPGQGTQTFDGERYRTYLPTPAFPAYVSGHTGFTATGAELLRLYTRSDAFGGSAVVKAGTSKFDPGHPAADVRLYWPTLSAAADEVGLSRLYGGVHWEFDHEAGTRVGRQVARAVWTEAQRFIDGG